MMCSFIGVPAGGLRVKAWRPTGVFRIRTEQSTGSPDISGDLWEFIEIAAKTSHEVNR
jgi:hypothetical protein